MAMGRKEKILVVDDEEIVRIQLGRVLSREGYDVYAAGSGEEALALMENTQVDLVLSDMVMERMDGLALLREVNRRYPGTIFIIITGHGSLATAIDSMRLGAFDYLLKPCDDGELKVRVARGLKERRLQKKVEHQTRRLERMAITDGLTGLYSRSYFMEALNREFKHFLRYRSPLSFMMIDIDFFKKINDAFGHPVGDSVLINISGMFRGMIRETDVIGRYGGEEFGVIQPRTGPEGARVSAARILSAVASDETLCVPPGEPPQRVTVSIGIASCPHEAIESAVRLIEAADTALYEAKRRGRNRLVVFEEEMGSGLAF
jgi:diguanylate cyclase (GGDEF)-like protein